jgi:hypothetical protein
VEYKMIASGRLDLGRGIFIADPNFAFPLIDSAFGWRMVEVQGVNAALYDSSLRIEFDGNQAETVSILSTLTPVLPGRSYRLMATVDSSELSAPQDAGFLLRAMEPSGQPLAACEILRPSRDGSNCSFRSAAVPEPTRIELMYKRALGTVRVKGVLRVRSVSLGLEQ